MEEVSTKKLVEEVAERTGLAEGTVRACVEALVEKAVEVLARGGRVEIEGLVSLSADDSPEGAAKGPRTGAPVSLPKAGRIRVRVAEAARRRVAEGDLSSEAGILVAKEDDPWAGEVGTLLARAGCAVTVGRALEEALRASREEGHEPSFVMIGPSIDDPTSAEISRELKLDPSTSGLAVVLGRPDLSGLLRPRSVQIVPDGTFDSAEGAVEIVRSEAGRWRERIRGPGRQVTLRSPSDPPSVERLKTMLEGFYGDALRDETEAYKTLSAFREAIDNAANHGNANSPDRHLTVALMQDDERIALEVTDEGDGFEHEKSVAAGMNTDAADTARERLGRGGIGGLGMRLMADCTDELRYSDGGTRVTLVKRRRAGPG